MQGVFIFKEQNVSRRSNSDQSDAMEKGFTLFKSPSPLITLSALIKKSNEAAVSPENAKKMFDLLNETVDRYCVCACLEVLFFLDSSNRAPSMKSTNVNWLTHTTTYSRQLYEREPFLVN